MKKTRLLLAALFAMSVPLAAQNFVADPASLPGGLSYPQWTVKWSQWAMSIPFPINPVYDATGAYCDIDQSGPVWFLAGMPGGPINCVVPAGKMIFFPVDFLIVDYPCPDPTFHPGPGQSLEQFLTIGYGLNAGARRYIDVVTALSVSLDGVPVQNQDLSPTSLIPKYRATSPLFVFQGDRSLQPVDPCSAPGHKAVTDGYWIMLKPLSPGSHILLYSVTVTFSGATFSWGMTYNLTIP
jgi:hypothetical protein